MKTIASALKSHILSCFRDEVLQEVQVGKEALLQFGLSSQHAALEENQQTDAVAFSIAHTPRLLMHEFSAAVDEFARQRGGRCDVGVIRDSVLILYVSHLPGLRSVIVRKGFLRYDIAILNTG